MCKLYTDFDEIYAELLEKAYAGTAQHNKRTDTTVFAFYGEAFKWDLQCLPLSNLRPMYIKTAAAEVAWKLSGKKSIEWLKKYTSIWDDFVDENDEVATAYGYRWCCAFGVNQVKNIIQKLQEDPSSRQQLLLSWDPRVDNVEPAKNVPCPWASQYAIIEKTLYATLHLRSNDILYGFPYDLLMYTLLAQAFANTLKTELGHLMYTISHGHIYQNQVEAAYRLVHTSYLPATFYYRHPFSIEDIIAHPDAFVKYMIDVSDKISYQPIDCTRGYLPNVVV